MIGSVVAGRTDARSGDTTPALGQQVASVRRNHRAQAVERQIVGVYTERLRCSPTVVDRSRPEDEQHANGDRIRLCITPAGY